MDVNEWMSYKFSDEGTCTQNTHNSSTRSHPSEEEHRARNRSKSQMTILLCLQSFAENFEP